MTGRSKSVAKSPKPTAKSRGYRSTHPNPLFTNRIVLFFTSVRYDRVLPSCMQLPSTGWMTGAGSPFLSSSFSITIDQGSCQALILYLSSRATNSLSFGFVSSPAISRPAELLPDRLVPVPEMKAGDVHRGEHHVEQFSQGL